MLNFFFCLLCSAFVFCFFMSVAFMFKKYLPFVFGRDELKIWKECMKSEIVKYENDGYHKINSDLCNVEYYWFDNNHYAVVFVYKDKKEAAIYEDFGTYNCVFSSYWEYHSNKLVLKLEDWKRNNYK